MSEVQMPQAFRQRQAVACNCRARCQHSDQADGPHKADRRRPPARQSAHWLPVQLQQVLHALRKRRPSAFNADPAIGFHAGKPLAQLHQAFRQRGRAFLHKDTRLIRRGFARPLESPAPKPHERVEPEQRRGKIHYRVPERITHGQMGHLVCKHHLLFPVAIASEIRRHANATTHEPKGNRTR